MPIQLPALVQRTKRIGRGIGRSGAKSGRGMKGQKSRAGYRRKAGFEGGQTPLYMRLPKGRGTKQRFNSQVRKLKTINVERLNAFDDNTIVGLGVLRKHNITDGQSQQVKLVGNTPLKKKLTVRVHAVSSGAKKSVEASGGKIELIQQ